MSIHERKNYPYIIPVCSIGSKSLGMGNMNSCVVIMEIGEPSCNLEKRIGKNKKQGSITITCKKQYSTSLQIAFPFCDC